MSRRFHSTLFLGVALALGACGQSNSSSPVGDPNLMMQDPSLGSEDAGGTKPQLSDILDTAVGAGSFSTLVTAVQAAGLVETLKSEGPFTVFAPTDAAFAKIPADQLNAIIADKELLTSILLYHVVPGKLLAADVLGKTALTTAQGKDAQISLRDGAPFISDAKIVATDVLATNGVIHVIDSVILPPAAPSEPAQPEEPSAPQLSDIVDTAVGAGSFSTLVTAVQAAGLVETLKGEGPFTVFAPTDAAFAKIPADQLNAIIADKELLTSILLYHVVPGKLLAADVLGRSSLSTAQGSTAAISLRDGAPFINDAKIVATDVLATNGVIHVIDSVILPPSMNPSPTQPDEPTAPQLSDIVDTAVAAGSFSTLVTAVQAAGLVDVLKGEGPFTVFAPTDAAFAKIPADQLNAIIADKELLTKILLYHVVPGKLLATDVLGQCKLPTAQGQELSVRLSNGEAFVNQSKIIATDVLATNGVIHVIDTVLLPNLGN